MDKSQEALTISVREAGRRIGLSANASYRAAASGQIPAIRVGRNWRVPIRSLERLLDEADQRRAASQPAE
jgi:excisionase family DNA binding protein